MFIIYGFLLCIFLQLFGVLFLLCLLLGSKRTHLGHVVDKSVVVKNQTIAVDTQNPCSRHNVENQDPNISKQSSINSSAASPFPLYNDSTGLFFINLRFVLYKTVAYRSYMEKIVLQCIVHYMKGWINNFFMSGTKRRVRGPNVNKSFSMF